MDQVFFILILSAPGAGAFSGDFTTNLARQRRAFSRALKIEKLKAPLFRGPVGARATNDWCINCPKKIKRYCKHYQVTFRLNYYCALFLSR